MQVKDSIDWSSFREEEISLLPILPMVYIAWSDGVLTPTEINTIRKKFEALDFIDEKATHVMEKWLSPTSPPSPRKMQRWLALISQVAQLLPQSEKRSLVNLATEIASIGAHDKHQHCTTEENCRALCEIEEALGVLGNEATRIFFPKRDPSEPMPEAHFDIDEVKLLLDGKYQDFRRKILTILCDPVFQYESHPDIHSYRNKILLWCKEIAAQGMGALSFPKAYGGENDLAKFIIAIETLSFHDLSLVIKFGVQFGLFGGSVLFLGSKTHHDRYLHDIGTMKVVGCFAMTELGHGSNVRDLLTTATFDSKTDEFIIHTPSEQARKDYIGNAAEHATMATVFAQLKIKKQDHGVHAFLVPIRKADGNPQEGVQIEDCGEKMGLNGVDNGRLWFDQVKIPRENLLDHFASVSSKGEYTSSISSSSTRFFTMLGTLVGGRIGIAAAALSGAKSGLTIATRYAFKRRQFGAVKQPETLLIDYLTHQLRLIPLIAKTYALNFSVAHLVDRYTNRTEEEGREIEGLAAGIKAYSTWHTTHTIQTCRECCGGQGYLSINRFAALKADTEVFTTFEGDNTVLMQLVAKGLLAKFQQQFHEMDFFGLIGYIAQQATTIIVEKNPIITRITEEEHLRNPEFYLEALRYREEHILMSVAKRLKKRIDQGKDSYQAFIECQDHLMSMANAYIEKVITEQFLKAIEKSSERSLPTLQSLCDLFALHCIERDSRWFLENGYIEGGKSRAIRSQVKKLCHELKPQAIYLVEAFSIPDECLHAPIALPEK